MPARGDEQSLKARRSFVRRPQWTRPYTSDFAVLVAVFASVGTAFVATILAVTISQLMRQGSHVSPWAVPAFVGFGTVWLTFAWRLARTALLLGKIGIRIRWVGRTRTIPWSQIERFETEAYYPTPRGSVGNARLWIRPTDQRKVRTPVQRLVHRWMSHAGDGGAGLSRGDYDATVMVCEQALATARAAAQEGYEPDGRRSKTSA